MLNRKLIYLILLVCVSESAPAQVAFQSSTPEQEGIPSEEITAFINSLENKIQSVHSFILLRHGKIIAEGWWNPYQREIPHSLFSLSKSFTSAAIGFAVQEKLLSIHDRVISFFPDDVPINPSDNLKNMRVKDLLTMSTGHRNDAFGPMSNPMEMSPVKAFLALPVEQKPGTLFIYNTGASFMLSAIIQKVSGKKLVDYLQPRLFEPLDIKNPQWGEGFGMNWGGFGLSVNTEAIAKFGQLYLQKGIWKGKQILLEEWINQSSAKQVSNGSDPLGNWDQGYGFQFWRNQKHGYRADGAFGQFCFIYPKLDMVLAMTSGTGDTKGVMDLVSDQLLPAFVNKKLAEDPIANAALKNKLQTLKLPTALGSYYSPLANKFSGKTYQLSENGFGLKSANFSFNKSNNTIELTTSSGTEKITSQSGQWSTAETLFNGSISFTGDQKLKIASSGSWLNDNTFALKIAYLETETILKLTFKFEGNKVSIQGERNVNFGPTKLPEIIGVAN